MDPRHNPFAVLYVPTDEEKEDERKAKAAARRKAKRDKKQAAVQAAAQLLVQQQVALAQQAFRDNLRNVVVGRLTQSGFATRQNTYFKSLTEKVTSQNQILSAHLTVTMVDLNAIVDNAAGNVTANGVLAALGYHVTFEEHADDSDPGNPRWYRNGNWVVTGRHVGLQNIQEAQFVVQEAQGVMNDL